MTRFLFGIVLFVCILCYDITSAQSYAFGLKGGATLGMQKWNSFERDPQLKYHGDLYIESVPDDERFAFFAQLGYHVKGTAQRSNRYIYRDPNDPGNPQGIEIPARTDNLEFHNLSLVIGGKQKFDFGLLSKAYYSLGIRGDYNLSRNLDGFFAIYDDDQLINKFTYGLSVGVGLEVPFSDLIGGMLELSVSPDVSKQLFIPRQTNTGYFYTNGTPYTVPEQNVYNVVFEISLGLRFLHRIIYTD